MLRINDDLWLWATSIDEKIISLKKEIEKNYSLSEIPDTDLYHYTNADGFKGIIDSKGLWLTDINYMNDADELKYAQNLIKSIIEDYQYEVSDHRIFFEKLERLADPFGNSFDIYITCFCEEGKLLSQWKSYGLYSVGFGMSNPIRANPSTFSRVGNWYKATLRKVVYDKDQQLKTIKDIIDSIFKLYKEKLLENDKKPNMVAQDYARVFANFVMPYVLCFKDEVFKEEKEWRLIHIQDNKSHENVKFRSAGEYLIPYIECEFKTVDELKFDEYQDELDERNRPLTVSDQEKYVNKNGIFPLKEVIIGPDPHHKIAKSSAKKFLSKKGFTECIVSSKSKNLRKGW